MKIGINTIFFRHPASGSGQYLIHLLNALADIDTKNEYVLVGPDSLSPGVKKQLHIPFPHHARAIKGPLGRNPSLEKMAWEQWTGPHEARRLGVDLFHVPHFAPPLFTNATPVVATIHDVIPLRLPLYHASAKARVYTSVVSRAAHKATMIITVSQHAKQDIVDALKLPAERIRVTYLAVSDEMKPVEDPEKLAAARARYGITGRYIFYLGGLDARKNVPQLIRAFAHLYKRLNEPGLQLLISGNPDKQRGSLFPDPRPVAADLGMNGQILFRFVEDEDKPAMYSGASAFVFPSLYEGFGLDPLEAMSCGAPVICSNRTSLPEVVGDAAISLDPENLPALVDAMDNVLTNAELSADLRARGLQRARQFSWHKTASETLAVYEEAIARRKR
ncbi:MAG TPA: glycosyltransferase family 1 protein [Ktedonobacteraceae bacterium]|nr:glycosyltransferase family 1 protein [Ktedonobacteraceae bacterium]